MPCCKSSSVVWEISWHSTIECQLSHVVAKSDTRIYELYGPAFSSRLVAFIEDLDLPMLCEKIRETPVNSCQRVHFPALWSVTDGKFMWLAAYVFSYCSCLPWMKIANLREAIPNLIKASSVVHYRYDYRILWGHLRMLWKSLNMLGQRWRSRNIYADVQPCCRPSFPKGCARREPS